MTTPKTKKIDGFSSTQRAGSGSATKKPKLRTVKFDIGSDSDQPPAKRRKASGFSRTPVFDLSSSQMPQSSQNKLISKGSSLSKPREKDVKGKGKAKAAPAPAPKSSVIVVHDSDSATESEEDMGAVAVEKGKRPAAAAAAASSGSRKEVRGYEDEEEDDQLWVDKYQPTCEADLAVHKRKVEDVRRWLEEAFEGGPSGKLRKYRRILALTGPAGTAKTATLRVLAREMGFEIVEWRNGANERPWTANSMNIDGDVDADDLPALVDTESTMDKFEAFLLRASACSNIFSAAPSSSTPAVSSASTSTSAAPLASVASTSSRPARRTLILLEDLPNVLHAPTQARLRTALAAFASPSSNNNTPGPPLALVISDSGAGTGAGDTAEWDTTGGRYAAWSRGRREVVDVRSVLGPEVLGMPGVMQVAFNPVAKTIMGRALVGLVGRHFDGAGRGSGMGVGTGLSQELSRSSISNSQRSLGGKGKGKSRQKQKQKGKKPSREVLDLIVESANGDIRSAIMALQFACLVELPGSSSSAATGGSSRKGPNKGGTGNAAAKAAGGGTSARAVLEAVTRREQSLVLFHLMGKVLYNKRKGDPPSSHLSAKDASKERALDAALPDEPALPSWLVEEHGRRRSRVDVEQLAADAPIDAGMLALYVHQNYTLFCDDVDQCGAVLEGLSWGDWVGGSFPSNPYAFPTVARSTLHALPSPVTRRGQKVCKPAWFAARTAELDAAAGVGDVVSWLARRRNPGTSASSLLSSSSSSGPNAEAETEDERGDGSTGGWGRWACAEVATELGGWLGAAERCFSASQSAARGDMKLPRTHRLFSSLPWTEGGLGGEMLGEDEDGVDQAFEEDEGTGWLGAGLDEEEETKGWLDDDDIEEEET
ncbi:hypothetical protein CONPUDRAFT_167507 [Coniophora puteana RWD-64-598 SS2]|uniref:Rad17-domain-containing protein n=1 Tax=Coniophora puteana (strain RWD-64-598) TaxID=741705 RepID=A0A5M3MHH5_CONPW|nr:uncharacterized protein CONPUDRAFT_167507 [Coniophora puteana RWD-64-598 SS2]EIW78507.1 hypothetical protein CONPUDRAFT_167507 [Coniophora puteana RWD-64-598 SS2]